MDFGDTQLGCKLCHFGTSCAILALYFVSSAMDRRLLTKYGSGRMPVAAGGGWVKGGFALLPCETGTGHLVRSARSACRQAGADRCMRGRARSPTPGSEDTLVWRMFIYFFVFSGGEITSPPSTIRKIVGSGQKKGCFFIVTH